MLRKAIWLGTIVMIIDFVLCVFFPEYLVKFFTNDPVLSTMASRGMRIVCSLSPVVGFQIVTGNFFQSIGMAKRSIFMSVSRQLVFLVPFLLIFPEIWGTDGVWGSIAAADGVASLVAAFLLWHFYHNRSVIHVPRTRMSSTLKRVFFHNRVTP